MGYGWHERFCPNLRPVRVFPLVTSPSEGNLTVKFGSHCQCNVTASIDQALQGRLGTGGIHSLGAS